jgi:hypothetical protein
VLHAITEAEADSIGQLDERLYRCTVRPTALLLKDLREVPVIESRPRRDAGGQQGVDESIVEVETCFVHDAATVRKDTRPRNAEAVRADPK